MCQQAESGREMRIKIVDYSAIPLQIGGHADVQRHTESYCHYSNRTGRALRSVAFCEPHPATSLTVALIPRLRDQPFITPPAGNRCHNCGKFASRLLNLSDEYGDETIWGERAGAVTARAVPAL